MLMRNWEKGKVTRACEAQTTMITSYGLSPITTLPPPQVLMVDTYFLTPAIRLKSLCILITHEKKKLAQIKGQYDSDEMYLMNTVRLQACITNFAGRVNADETFFCPLGLEAPRPINSGTGQKVLSRGTFGAMLQGHLARNPMKARLQVSIGYEMPCRIIKSGS